MDDGRFGGGTDAGDGMDGAGSSTIPIEPRDAPQLAQSALPIGEITVAEGPVHVTHADGTREDLGVGGQIFANDTVATESGGSVEIRFVDGTTFGLGGGAEMTIDRLVYDPAGSDNAMTLSVSGAFLFATGLIASADGDGMQVVTPPGTIGIRGTSVAGQIDPVQSGLLIALLRDLAGHVGIVQITNAAGTRTLDELFEATLLVDQNTPPGASFSLTSQQIQQFYGLLLQLNPELLLQNQSSLELEDIVPSAGGTEGKIISGEGINTQFLVGMLQGLTDFFGASLLGATLIGTLLPSGTLDDTDLANKDPSVGDDDTIPPEDENGQGGNGNDTIFGTPEADTLIGDDNSDTIFGDKSGDTIRGLGGPDLIFAQGGGDSVEGGDGDDTIQGGIDNDTACGEGGDDSVVGDLGDDSLCGGAGNDFIQGSNGSDTLSGEDGDDLLVGGDGTDTMSGGEGDDTVLGNAGGDTLAGDDGDDSVLGDAGDDSIDGGNGDDFLDGGIGNDTIDGGAGDDSIIGGGSGSEGPDGPVTPLVVGDRTPGVGGNALINGLGGPAGFGEQILNRNDDGSTGFIDVTSIFSGGMTFFGNTYTGFYINNNGNITFENPLSTFTPFALTGPTGNPIIAAFFADVDTRGTAAPAPTPGGNSTGSNLLYYDFDEENGVITITWDDVGYFANHTDKLNAFQLVIYDDGGGNFSFEFRYENIDWTTGDASGGSGGLGGTIVRAGWNSGTGTFFELPQSGNQAEALELETTSNAGTTQDGNWVFHVVNGVVVTEQENDLLRGGAGDDTIRGFGGDDTLLGGAGHDLLFGGDGDDLLEGGHDSTGGGHDALDGGDGADTLVFDDIATEYNGGNGVDALLISASGDFAQAPPGNFDGIEIVDMRGAGNKTLTLEAEDILDLAAGNNTGEVVEGGAIDLVVRGEEGDNVDLGTGGFTQIATGVTLGEEYGGASTSYDVWSNNAGAVVAVEQDVSVTAGSP